MVLLEVGERGLPEGSAFWACFGGFAAHLRARTTNCSYAVTHDYPLWFIFQRRNRKSKLILTAKKRRKQKLKWLFKRSISRCFFIVLFSLSFFFIQFLFKDSTIELLVCSRVFMFLFEAHLLVISQIGDGCVRKTFSMTNIFLCYSEGWITSLLPFLPSPHRKHQSPENRNILSLNY